MAYGHDYPYAFAKLPTRAQDFKRTQRNIEETYRYSREGAYPLEQYREGRRHASFVYRAGVKTGVFTFADALNIAATCVHEGTKDYWWYDGFVGVMYQLAAIQERADAAARHSRGYRR